MDDLVTIVIPVYNVEKYLNRCVESVLKQTVSRYRIILVDDGSTDKSGDMCDRWAAQSDIITSLHKPNGGLSDARNYGTQLAETKYVTFVDSDDYVEPQYIELLVDGLKTGADMVVTHHVQEYEDNPQKAVITNKYDICSTKHALKMLCYERLSTCAWGKLFPTKFVLEESFPVGKLYEDLLTIYKYIGRSRKIAFNRSQTYHYLQRKGSIRQGKWSEKYFDVMEGAENLLKYIDKRYPVLHDAAIFRYYYSANELYVKAFEASNYKNIIKPVQKTLKCHIREILNNKDASNKYKIQYLLMAEFPNIYKKVWIYKKRRK